MATPEGMQTIAGRLATFEGPQQTAKRRTSTKKKTLATISWPHTSPSPEQLAKAGFYYKPSATNEDNVTCFLCQKSLDGWDTDDNPALEHLAHVPDCGWAINVCIEQRMQDDDRAEEDPLNERMMESRRATFRDAWPHESKKAWKCKTQKMVEAGWCYNPVPEADDCVQCFYCGVSLDGWEPKDDPWAEHQKRAPECHFFTLVDESKKLRKGAKGKKGRPSRTSKQSRLSTQSSLTINSETHSSISMDYTTLDEDDTMMSTATTTSRTGRGRKATVEKKTAPNAKRTTKTKTLASDDAQLPEYNVESDAEQDAEIDATNLSVVGKKSKGKRQPKRTASEAPESPLVVRHDEPIGEPLVQKKTRPRANKKPSKPTEDNAEQNSHHQATIDDERSGVTSKAKRSKKRTSDGQEKVDDSIIIVEQSELEHLPTKPSKPKATRGRKKKASEQPLREGPLIDDAIKPSKPAGSNTIAESSPAMPQPNVEAAPLEEVVESTARKQISSSSRSKPIIGPTAKEIPAVAQKQVKSTKNKIPSPSPSPQSSDAENQAPSSRPSFNAALDEAEIGAVYNNASTPTQSSSKHTLIAGGLQSAFPWKAVDLEKALILSPNSRADGLGDVDIEEVFQRMASPEKTMTIEGWIHWNAQRAEERLKQDCERLVSVFEKEGVRALRAVEGIECV